MTSEIFLEPRIVSGPEECTFYHTLDLPGFGLQHGNWDLRRRIDRYLSPVDFRNRRVLEVGASDGYLVVELEKRGAEVIAFDLPLETPYDRFPGSPEPAPGDRRRRVHNAFWLVLQQHGSKARRAQGHAGNLPAAIGPVDYCFIGNVMVHLKDPMQALTSAAALAKEGIIVTEALWDTTLDLDRPIMQLMTPQKIAQGDPSWFCHWWQVTPGVVSAWLSILGFPRIERYEHRQLFAETGAEVPHFTIVARRR